MADTSEKKTYQHSRIEDYSGKEHSRIHKNPEMVLNLETKPDSFISDQTPTPIKLIKKCEEMGLFEDLPNMNPFEETFRRAAEDMRSGIAPLEMSSLSVPNNSDDSLHTPHVIFPSANDFNRRKRPISPRDLSSPIMQPDPDPLCLSLESDESVKQVVQQEADTSDDTKLSSMNSCSQEQVEASLGTIQFLLRMPNGKMVQLSTLPVEQMDAAPQGPKDKDIPVIKVDSSFLKTEGDGARQNTTNASSATSVSVSNGMNFNTSSGSKIVHANDSSGANKIHNLSPMKLKTPSVKISDSRETTEQLSKMSLAKQKLKQALMNNNKTNWSSSSGVISSSGTVSKVNISEPQYVETRRESIPSDDGAQLDDSNSELSSVEEKRKRNRAAAMRCREKRKTWVKELEQRANDMLRTNGQLQYEVSMLRDEVAQLKTLLLAHRDCPVTQAMVQGKATQPLGTKLSVPTAVTSPPITKRSISKAQKSPPSTIVLQSPVAVNPIKPLIFLNDPPAKRKRLNSSTSSPSTNSPSGAVSVVSSSPSSSLHTFVLPSKNTTVLNPSFVNVIPSVLVANPTTSTSNSVGAPSQVIYSLPCLPQLTSKPGVNMLTTKQAYILPKAKVNTCTSEKSSSIKLARYEGKFQTSHLLSTNVIKVNPNVVERDSNDSDIEILDVK